jgi:hypothetical protein
MKKPHGFAAQVLVVIVKVRDEFTEVRHLFLQLLFMV